MRGGFAAALLVFFAADLVFIAAIGGRSFVFFWGKERLASLAKHPCRVNEPAGVMCHNFETGE